MLTDTEYRIFSSVVKNKYGINLDSIGRKISESKLLSMCNNLGDMSCDLVCKGLNDNNSLIVKEFINEFAIGETYFMRDKYPFLNLNNYLKNYLGKTANLNILSCACSSGQEPYSIAMSLLDSGIDDFRISAFDLSDDAIKKSRDGIYNEFEVMRGLTEDMRIKYFSTHNGLYTVRARVKNYIDFFKGNLMESRQLVGGFDLIFCRNVLIYFELEEMLKVFEGMQKIIKPEALIILGSYEVLPKKFLDKHKSQLLDAGVYLIKQ